MAKSSNGLLRLLLKDENFRPQWERQNGTEIALLMKKPLIITDCLKLFSWYLLLVLSVCREKVLMNLQDLSLSDFKAVQTHSR